jgi:hypothetical protein
VKNLFKSGEYAEAEDALRTWFLNVIDTLLFLGKLFERGQNIFQTYYKKYYFGASSG